MSIPYGNQTQTLCVRLIKCEFILDSWLIEAIQPFIIKESK